MVSSCILPVYLGDSISLKSIRIALLIKNICITFSQVCGWHLHGRKKSNKMVIKIIKGYRRQYQLTADQRIEQLALSLPSRSVEENMLT